MKSNSKLKTPILCEKSAWFGRVKTGRTIMAEVKAIIESSPQNLADNLTSYIIRGRNDLLRACKNRLNASEIEELLHRTGRIQIPVFKIDADPSSLSHVVNREHRSGTIIKLPGKRISNIHIVGLVQCKDATVLLVIGSNERPDVCRGYNSHVHGGVAKRSTSKSTK